MGNNLPKSIKDPIIPTYVIFFTQCENLFFPNVSVCFLVSWGWSLRPIPDGLFSGETSNPADKMVNSYFSGHVFFLHCLCTSSFLLSSLGFQLGDL